MKEARRGVCVAPARAAYDRLFRDSTLIGAKRLGFEIARFNPGIGDLLPDGPGTVPETSWAVLDNHVHQCIRHGLDILLTLARPPAGGSWNSVEYEDGFWEWDQLDYEGVLDLYIAIIDRVVTDNSFPPERLFVEVANEASLRTQGGVQEIGPPPKSTGVIQPLYLVALSNLIIALKVAFRAVTFLSHAFAFVDPARLAAMENPWKTEWEAFLPTPPALLTACDILNVHIYFGYKKSYGIMPWDEYARNVVALFDAFLEQRDAMPDPEWDVVKAKPVWITETGVSYVFAGMEVDGFKWGNQDQLALFRTAAYDDLCFHEKADAVFEFCMRNELEEYDARDHPFNEGILNFDGSITASYERFAIMNGADDIVYPLHFVEAEELVIT